MGSGTFGLGFDGTTMAPALLPLSPTRTAKRDEAEAEAEAEAAAAAADVMEQVLDQIDRRDEDMTMLKASPAAGVANLDRMGVCERNELELSIEQQADFSRDQANAIVYEDLGLILTVSRAFLGAMPPRTCRVVCSYRCPHVSHADWCLQSDVVPVSPLQVRA